MTNTSFFIQVSHVVSRFVPHTAAPPPHPGFPSDIVLSLLTAAVRSCDQFLTDSRGGGGCVFKTGGLRGFSTPACFLFPYWSARTECQLLRHEGKGITLLQYFFRETSYVSSESLDLCLALKLFVCEPMRPQYVSPRCHPSIRRCCLDRV
jgi:hypothetical protein